MYDRILVAIDATPSHNNITLQRAETFAQRWASIVHLLHVGRGHIVPGDITGGTGLSVSGHGVVSAADDTDVREREIVQQAVDKLSAAGIEAHGELVNATEHDIAEVILQRAEELKADLIVLGHEHHRGPGNVFRASVAEQVIRHHPPCSILLARPPHSV
ncbi:universal stress protein [Pseudonocardia sp. H11422]|uniref:universal stress protein n=1 Tax=Pseudonocardia sp. H11422 TaxID=2835866 RepID=UPI001BDC09BC|nr:universal stress protein [Pseudonocardia sp. H11422]